MIPNFITVKLCILFNRPSNATPNDVLILTKPLGTQLATNSYIWMIENTDNWNKIKDVINKNDIETSYLMAIESMCRLNLIAAKLMHKHRAHGATDVTGFGLYGHAKNLVEFQTNNVSFEIHTLPIIKNCRLIAEKLQQTKLLRGTAVETSGNNIYNNMSMYNFGSELYVIYKYIKVM